MTKRLLFIGVAMLLQCAAFAHGYEYGAEDTTRLMTEMITDIGGHDAVRANNGKILRCTHRGTKKITIVQKDGLTRFTAEYGNCQENGKTRDGVYEVVLRGDEIVSSTSRRSKNGHLFDAAMNDDAGKVRELIKAKADVNYTESTSRIEGVPIDEWTPLMSAAVSGNLDIVKQLVAAGAWVNYMNSLAVNAVWIAANNGKLDVVKYLVRHGAYIDNRNKEDVTPLMAAAMNGHLEVVRFLIDVKANLDLVHNDGNGDTALMFALANGHTAIARYLVEAGANVDIRNKFGVDALHIAAAEGNTDGMKILIEHNADLTARIASGMTALEIARAKGHTAVAETIEKAFNKTK
ncbi:ankyrin repeat domain-containing protein [Geobacter sp.]|uniref:ankyrin repeat domain-containing protein n=1 Tax=Geobacter sp. TaxID=46610 RepID=UPI001AD274AD|nr:ankyrin repeat domain-containing protein [Geobacter sp.]CAG0946517.1 hypothetical protein ANRL1_03067 [Anaerolineae bacterium]